MRGAGRRKHPQNRGCRAGMPVEGVLCDDRRRRHVLEISGCARSPSFFQHAMRETVLTALTLRFISPNPPKLREVA